MSAVIGWTAPPIYITQLLCYYYFSWHAPINSRGGAVLYTTVVITLVCSLTLINSSSANPRRRIKN